ncbi:AT-rich interactive domain-containing protein 5A [Diretmus argenteus]
MVLEAEDDHGVMSERAADSEEDGGKEATQTCSGIEIGDSGTECEEEEVQVEEKSFVSRLYSFMKDRGTPIERIPHLGFKQINLWRIYKAVEILGGYDSVTARRLWKNVYDELGGSPGSTSAATCTRRHYERLVLPFERHLRGEEDKPLPPSKPRKPYKRNVDGKSSKTEGRKKRTPSDSEMESELQVQMPDAAGQCETATQAHSTWAVTSDRHNPDCSQPSRGSGDLCSVYTCSHIVQVPTTRPWTSHIPPAAGEVISPLEKKKRVAQASLNLPPSPQGDDRERPSVIRCSQSPALASSSQTCNSSEGSPLPLSSSSSRSPSPYSVSSEDSPAGNECPSSTELQPNYSSSEDKKSLSCSPMFKDLTGQNKDVSHVSPQPLNTDSSKGQTKDSAWKPIHKGSDRTSAHPRLLSTASPFSVQADWVPTSSFTKVTPKSVQPLRPTPFSPGYKLHQSRLIQHDDSLVYAKKLHGIAPWFYPTEKREKSRTMLPKVFPTQQSLSHSSAGSLPVPCLLTGYDRSGRDSRHQPLLHHPAFLPGRMRLPHSQPVYRHIPMGPAHSALIGPAIYSYPYPIPLWGPHADFTLPGMNSNFPHKL